MYVIFEGIDTTGKSTQVELFSQKNEHVIATKEPGGTPIGVKLREMLLGSDEKLSFNAELLLFLADRAEHYEKIVEKNSDKTIISDRGFLSGIAYALTNHPELDAQFLVELNLFALKGQLPDKIVLFKTNHELITSRLGNKEKDSIEQRGIEYLLKVQEMMEKTLKTLEVEYLLVDSANSIEDIYEQIKEFLYD